MSTKTPMVLIASVSAYERHRLELALKRTGWTLCVTPTAEEASRAYAAHDGSSVLVIDSGLLEMAHDPQWRVLRSDLPELGAVVRCLIPGGGIQRSNGNTFLVHPDDGDAICHAIRLLDGSS